jgi:hypothetical protein
MMDTIEEKKTERPSSLKERYYCENTLCRWFRDRRKDNLETFIHPIYGKVTYLEAEIKDIAHHNCEDYADAIDRLHNPNLTYSHLSVAGMIGTRD